MYKLFKHILNCTAVMETKPAFSDSMRNDSITGLYITTVTQARKIIMIITYPAQGGEWSVHNMTELQSNIIMQMKR